MMLVSESLFWDLEKFLLGAAVFVYSFPKSGVTE